MSEKTVLGYVIFVVAVGKEHEVRDKIKDVSGVHEVSIVYGEYDIVAKVETESLEKLQKIIMDLRRVKGVLRTVTLISA